jgi:hypothetical protein
VTSVDILSELYNQEMLGNVFLMVEVLRESTYIHTCTVDIVARMRGDYMRRVLD